MFIFIMKLVQDVSISTKIYGRVLGTHSSIFTLYCVWLSGAPIKRMKAGESLTLINSHPL